MLFGIKKEDTKHIVKFLKLAKNKLWLSYNPNLKICYTIRKRGQNDLERFESYLWQGT
jgi:hypothetical protein